MVAYFLAGYPDRAASLSSIRKGAAAGVDVFEIGYPSLNPYCDGEVISRAHAQVIKQGALDTSYWRAVRAAADRPVWIMAYKADFIDTGVYRHFAREKLIDALVLPDCTEQTRLELQVELVPQCIEVIGFANPEMPADQFKRLLKQYRTIYFQRYVGKTGSPAKIERDIPPYFEADMAESAVILAGFGINTPEKARGLIFQGFDGVVIGTALVQALNESEETMLNLVRDISRAIKS
jgi:tryptophan synthase alpha chain